MLPRAGVQSWCAELVCRAGVLSNLPDAWPRDLGVSLPHCYVHMARPAWL